MAIKISNQTIIDDSRRIVNAGVSTISGVSISSGIVTASGSGIVTYYGDGQYLQNISGTGFQGVQGIQGRQGIQGLQGGGFQGIQGISVQGTTGTQGIQGLQGGGFQGIQGISVQGTTGTQGIQGLQGGGFQGIQGSQGPQGIQGIQGTSVQGTTGTQGLQGLQGGGFQGIQGLQGGGFQGIQGSQGPQGIQGIQGTSVQGTTGNQGIQGISVQGTTGTQGIQGLQGGGFQGIQGSQGPQGIQGIQGTSVQGTTGTQGLQGLQGGGFQGIQGLQGGGFQGIQGSQGPQGIQGIQGTSVQGTTGNQGIQGTQGTTGTQGIQGLQGGGFQGIQGIQGNTGQAGISASGRIWYFSQVNSDIVGYETLQPDIPDSLSQDIMSGICSSTSGEVLLGSFATDPGDPGVTEIPAGEYEIRFYAYLSDASGITTFTFKNYLYNSGNETFLFEVTSNEINGISSTSPEYSTKSIISAQPIGIAASDRVVTKVYAATTNVGIITANFVHSGNTPSNWRTAISQGYVGPQGIQGTRGYQGIQGIQGSQGIQGIQGTSVQGTTGNQGIQGTSVQGTTGTQGIQGIQGTSVQGTTGNQGIQGSSVQGTTGNQGIQGIQGTSVQGTTGNQGIQGIQGTSVQGTTGNQGIQGTSVQGTTGTQGIQGIQGTSVQGTTGTQGIQGTSVQGTTGTQGIQGRQGIQGTSATTSLINATDDTTTTTLYPVMVGALGSDQTAKGRSTAQAFSFNASTNVLSAGGLSINKSGLGTVSGNTLTISDFIHTNSNTSYLRIKATRYADGTSWTTASTKLLVVTDVTEQSYVEFNPSNSASMAFGQGSTEWARFLSAGNLGIGTTNPAAQLHITGQFQSTQANNTATGGGQIYLNGATGNRIDFNTSGVAAPAFTTRSAGTKIVLFPQIGATNVDYALGIEGSTLWYSVPQAINSYQHRWYGGTTQLADLKGTGELVLGGVTTLTGTANQRLQVTGGAYISGNLGIGTTNPTENLSIVGNILLNTSAAERRLYFTNSSSSIYFFGQTGSTPAVGLFDATNARFAWYYTSVDNDLVLGPTTTNIGIGITNPSTKLDVVGIGQFTNNGQSLNLVGTDHTYIQWYPDGVAAGRKAYTGFPGAAANYFEIANEIADGTGHIYLNPGTSANVLIDTTTSTGTASQRLQVNGGAYFNGNVGIGTTNPEQPLHVISANPTPIIVHRTTSGNSAIEYRNTVSSMWAGFSNTGSGWGINDISDISNGPMLLVTRPTGEVLINSATSTGTSNQLLQVTGGAYVSGNLGIGTTNPASPLHVIGQEIIDNSGNQILLHSGVSSHPTVIHRNDASDYYVLLSAADTVPSGTWNALRPLKINLTSGLLTSSNGQSFAGGLTQTGDVTINSGELNFGVSAPKYIDFYTDNGTTTYAAHLRLVNDANSAFRNHIIMTRGGATTLYFGDATNGAKLATSSTGATITGTLLISNSASQSLTDGAVWLNGGAGSILLDDNANKRISWNDGAGNFNLRAGNYYSGVGVTYVKATTDANGGAATITLGADAVDGTISMAVAPIGVPGATVSYTNSVALTTTFTYTSGGPLVIQNTALTGTASQYLQVTGGAYVSGSVGIGITNPSVSLQVVGGIRARGGTPGANGINNNGYAFGSPGDNDSGMFSSADGQLEFYSNNAEVYRISNTGNVLINTTSNTGTASQKLQVTGGAYISGNLGIGTTNPTAKLHIDGNIDFIGDSVKIGYCAGFSDDKSTNYNNFIGYCAGYCNTTGSNNNFFGLSAGCSNISGSFNNFIGRYSGNKNTSGCNNNFIGHLAGNNNQSGNCNNFFGLYAGISNTTGCYNNFSGRDAGSTNTSGSNNNFFGSYAGYANTTTSNSIAIGQCAGYSNQGGRNIYLGQNAGFALGRTGCVTGTDNIIMGCSAGANLTSGTSNFFAGVGAGNSTTTSSNSIAIGASAGARNNASRNIFLGQYAGHFIGRTTFITGADNIVFGCNAGANLTSGTSNFFAGFCAGYSNLGGGGNNFFGATAGFSNTSGCFNNFIGGSAGYYNTIGNYNNLFGIYAGQNNTSGSHNNFFGNQAGLGNTISSNSIAIGQCAGYCNQGDRNIYLGQNSGFFVGRAGCVTGTDNIIMGCSAGACLTSGTNNFFAGVGAGNSTTTSSNSIAIGQCAGYSNQGDRNIYLGLNAGFVAGRVGCVTGTDNIVMGWTVGTCLTTGSNNIFLGCQTACNTTTGIRNIIIGRLAGRCNTTGSCNIFLGDYAGCLNNIGNDNIAIGRQSGYGNTGGCFNIFIGSNTGAGNSNSCYNIFIGPSAGLCNTSGCRNNFFGLSAGVCNTSGCQNIFFGQCAGYNNTTASNNIAIGQNAGTTGLTPSGLVNLTTTGNIIAIGNTNHTNFYTIMRSCATAGTVVHWSSSTYELFACSSSIRYKTNVRPFLSGVADLLKAEPVLYNSIEDPTGPDMVGFIAEQVDSVGLKEFVVYNRDHQPETVNYSNMITLAVNAIKELHEENENLKLRVHQLETIVGISSGG